MVEREGGATERQSVCVCVCVCVCVWKYRVLSGKDKAYHMDVVTSSKVGGGGAGKRETENRPAWSVWRP